MSTPPLHAVLLENVHAAAEEVLAAPELTVERLGNAAGRDELRSVLARADVIGLRSKTRLDAELIAAAPRLLAVGCFCIGTDQVDLEAARRHGIAVFNAPFSNTRSVAELTVAEIIALCRGLCDRSATLHAGRWVKSAKDAHEVRGRTLGIVGYGHIGSQVSILAEALGMRVLYHDVVPVMALGNAAAAPSLTALLERSDIVSLHVPATAQTRGMIGGEELERMRRGALLINNARGSVVDLGALADALRSGHLAGAAIDVFPSEPEAGDAPFSCPLSGLPNVILTPHIGGSTEEAQESIARDVGAKLARFLRNGSTTTSVNVPEVDLPHMRGDQHRILHFHRNVPGVLGRMHTMLAELGVNINAEYLQSEGDLSYVILDVDPISREAVRDGLSGVPETIRVRTVR